MAAARRLLALAVVPALWAARAERRAVRPHGPKISRHVAEARAIADEAKVARRPTPRPTSRRLFASAALLAAAALPGGGAQYVEERTTAEVLASKDTNKDGKVDLEEFLADARLALDEQGTADEAVRGRVLGLAERLFNFADIDGDGALEERELEYLGYLRAFAVGEQLVVRMARALGDPVEEDPEFGLDFTKLQVTKYDQNEDGVIDKEEYLTAMGEAAHEWGWSRYADDPEITKWFDELFAKADVDGDGTLSAKEVQYLSFMCDRGVNKEGKFDDRVLAGELFDQLDENGDGEIDKEEIRNAAEKEDGMEAAEAQEAAKAEEAARAPLEAAVDAAVGAALEGAPDVEQAALDAAVDAAVEVLVEEEEAGGEEEEEEEDEEPKTFLGRVQEHFAWADANGDGRLDREEALKMAQKIRGIPGEL